MTETTRLLGPGDEVALDTFLKPRTAEAYFLRGNALRGGLAYAGQALQAEYAATFEGSAIVGVAGYSWLNTLLVCGEPRTMQAIAQTLRPCIAAREGKVEAFLGLVPETDALIAGLGLTASDFRHNAPDWLFRVTREDLRVPALPSGFRLRLAEQTDRAQLIAWRIAFNIEATDATPGPALEKTVKEEIDRRLIERDLFVLENANGLHAFCGVSGNLPESVMVGPVWTPPEERCQGYAKAVTAAAIAYVMTERPLLQNAILFASRPDAIHLYSAIGFTSFADWRFALVKESVKVA